MRWLSHRARHGCFAILLVVVRHLVAVVEPAQEGLEIEAAEGLIGVEAEIRVEEDAFRLDIAGVSLALAIELADGLHPHNRGHLVAAQQANARIAAGLLLEVGVDG